MLNPFCPWTGICIISLMSFKPRPPAFSCISVYLQFSSASCLGDSEKLVLSISHSFDLALDDCSPIHSSSQYLPSTNTHISIRLSLSSMPVSSTPPSPNFSGPSAHQPLCTVILPYILSILLFSPSVHLENSPLLMLNFYVIQSWSHRSINGHPIEPKVSIWRTTPFYFRGGRLKAQDIAKITQSRKNVWRKPSSVSFPGLN